MPWLSSYAQKKKIQDFFSDIPKQVNILEIGCGTG